MGERTSHPARSRSIHSSFVEFVRELEVGVEFRTACARALLAVTCDVKFGFARCELCFSLDVALCVSGTKAELHSVAQACDVKACGLRVPRNSLRGVAVELSTM